MELSGSWTIQIGILQKCRETIPLVLLIFELESEINFDCVHIYCY